MRLIHTIAFRLLKRGKFLALRQLQARHDSANRKLQIELRRAELKIRDAAGSFAALQENYDNLREQRRADLETAAVSCESQIAEVRRRHDDEVFSLNAEIRRLKVDLEIARSEATLNASVNARNLTRVKAELAAAAHSIAKNAVGSRAAAEESLQPKG